ncbi:T9SS type A sorting domain-containing protein [Gramella sp. GC03-9]|uniref:T9SS type A sorting domain-containing protein n=1 Tax=Christiangramia oceanisediminis TaxID=2920386 RepID=A0A9X2KZ13_9FLAO|nr:T9SS type A sorting domain-containing protein [Gramella oceanisediminis]MCP9200761.1 T9SS type A sorting domain-containing protein [Gramella oceanisediminis]
MKLPLLFLMIFSFCSSTAQLYISPSEHEDSYLYVRDRLLFVKNEIHLTENKKKETAASIYLRKDAQLLQVDKPRNNNTGDGSLSVFQTGTSNAYDYNYWGLPVAVNGNSDKLSDIIFDPAGPTVSRNSHLISALDGKSSPLSISNRWLYSFSGTNYSHWISLGHHFSLKPGEGFTMKGVNGENLTEIEGIPVNPGSAQTYDFRGIPNDGTIELAITADQLLLVGNPYPSALNLDRFLIDNKSITGIAYFWDSKPGGTSHYLADYEGGYGTYSPGAGIYVPAVFRKQTGEETGEAGSYIARQVSPVAQGFMVKGKNNGKIIFQNSHRLYQKQEKNVSEFKSPETNIPAIRLSIEMDSVYTRQLVLAFRSDSSKDEDHAMDARKLDETAADVSWDLSGEKFVINVRPKVDEELIPLKIALEKETELKFYIQELRYFDPDRIFLYDSKDDLYFGIKTGYLKLKLPAGNYSDRFFISFLEKLPPVTTTDQAGETFKSKPPNVLLNTIDIYQNNRQEQLEVKILYDTGLESVQLFDLNGKLIFKQNLKDNPKEFNFSTGKLSPAVYIAKVKTSDNKELTKKIAVKN